LVKHLGAKPRNVSLSKKKKTRIDVEGFLKSVQTDRKSFKKGEGLAPKKRIQKSEKTFKILNDGAWEKKKKLERTDLFSAEEVYKSGQGEYETGYTLRLEDILPLNM